MNRSGKLHALLSTSRVANIPSVVSNVWVGMALGTLITNTGLAVPVIAWSTALRLVVAGVALYVAGNFLNDWADRKWDAERRPERALPRGLFSPALYAGIAGSLGILGVMLAATASTASAAMAAAIVVSICIYTYSHKRTPWSVLPMGLCRAFLPLMGMLGIADISDFPPQLLSTAGGLFFYIMGLSLSARYESMAVAPKFATWLSKGLLIFAALIMGLPFYGWVDPASLVWWQFLPYGIWLLFCVTVNRKPIPVYVSSLLAGIPLLDWIQMLPILGAMKSLENGWTPSAIACFAIPPLAFIFALLLQRLAPAT